VKEGGHADDAAHRGHLEEAYKSEAPGQGCGMGLYDPGETGKPDRAECGSDGDAANEVPEEFSAHGPSLPFARA